MNDFIEIIKRIHEQRNILPGKTAHDELFPDSRKNIPASDISKAKLSAVMMLIYPNIRNNAETVFIKRNEYKGHHSNQISFPGGKMDPREIDLLQTAIRETKEEIGISVPQENIITKLSELHIPVSNFLVQPYIGYINNTPKFIPDRNEVSKLIKIEVEELIHLPMQKTNLTLENKIFEIPYFPLKNEILWGATAMIVNEFRYMLKHQTPSR